MQLRQQLVLHVPTSWTSLCVHVCEGGKALLCHLSVEEGCQLGDEEGGDVLGDGQLCSDTCDCQAEEELPNSSEPDHCHNPSPDLLSAQHAGGPQTWSQKKTLVSQSQSSW